MIWASKSEGGKYTFNYEALKALNEGTQMRSDWVLPICSGHERIKDDNGDKAHPTQKPQSLLHRVLVGSTNPGDVVLDPFFGSGTTGAVAKMLGRDFIGIERDGSYRAIAETRIGKPANLTARRLKSAHRNGPSRASRLGNWSNAGCCVRAKSLVNLRGQTAKVRADGTLISDDTKGSIHQVWCRPWRALRLAMVGPTGTSNEKDKPVSIDLLRQQIRAEMRAN